MMLLSLIRPCIHLLKESCNIMNELKTKIRSKELSIGSWLTFSDLAIVEIMAKAGFDWLVIDMEHTGLSFSEVREIIRVIDLCGVVPLVRVMKNDPDIIKKCMDIGAHGVVVPFIKTKDEAERVVNAVKYPPFGTRGVGLGRAQNYSLDLDSYMKWNQTNSIVIVQIEHYMSVDNLEDIMSVEGVDAFIIGPYDLSGSVNLPGKFEHPKVKSLLDIIDKKSELSGFVKGKHVVNPDIDQLKKAIENNFTFIAYGVDFLFFSQNISKNIIELNKIR